MALDTLTEFVAALDRAGELVRVSHPVSLDREMCEIADRRIARLQIRDQTASTTFDLCCCDTSMMRLVDGMFRRKASAYIESSSEALAWNRPALRARLAWHAGRWREVLTAAFADAAAGYGLGSASVAPLVTLVVTFTQGMTSESLLGVEEGHDELLRWVDAWLASLEPPPATSVGPG